MGKRNIQRVCGASRQSASTQAFPISELQYRMAHSGLEPGEERLSVRQDEEPAISRGPLCPTLCLHEVPKEGKKEHKTILDLYRPPLQRGPLGMAGPHYTTLKIQEPNLSSSTHMKL